MPKILKSLQAITPEWLTSTLTDAGHSPPPVTSVEVAPMDGFVGALGEVAIFTVTYDSETDLPTEFVGKCPLDDDLARLYASVMLSYQREAGFYRTLASDIDMELATCYANLFDPNTHEATLLIERISGEKGDILKGTSFDRLHRLVGDLARMHGRYWMDESLLEHDWLIGWDEPTLLAGIPIVADSWNKFPSLHPDWYPADLRSYLDATFVADTASWLTRFAAQPWTFIHQDYELDNMVFRDDQPVILDWQTAMRSFPGIDLGWTLICSHSDETLAREDELLDHYRAEFAAAGGPSWSAETLLDNLALGAFYWASVNHVPVTNTAEAPDDDRAKQRFHKMLRGAISAAVRWDVMDRVPRM